MATITSFPSVPTKQRIASKLTAVLFQQVDETDVDLEITSVTVSTNVATVVADVSADPGIAIGDVVFLHDTGFPKLDGLQPALTASVFDVDEITITFSVTTDNGSTTSRGGLIEYSAFTPTSQITDFSSNVTSSTDQWSTLGTESSEEAGETTRPVSATAYLRDGVDQLGPILGTTSGAETTEKTELQTTGVHFLVTNWDGRVAASKMQNYTAIVNCAWNDWQQGKTAGGWVEWNLTGSADEIYVKAVAQS